MNRPFGPGDRVRIRPERTSACDANWQGVFTVARLSDFNGPTIVLLEKPNIFSGNEIGWRPDAFELVDDFVVSHTDWV
jgi:hypothetical protein